MDLPNVVTVKGFKEFNSIQKEQLYETLLDLRVAIDDIPKKSLRKTLELTLAVLAHKGQQVQNLCEQLETKTQASNLESLNESLIEENEQLKQKLNAMKDEKQLLNKKSKELHDEILILKTRLQEVVERANLSDRDSSDPLSELDKRETLLRNINAKNKHIKRLLKEIESLQNQNIEQTKSINKYKERLLHEENCYQTLRTSFNQLEKEKNTLKISYEDLNIEMKRLKGNIAYLENERIRNEKELKRLIAKLETEVKHWKKILEEKEIELNNLKKKKSKYLTQDVKVQEQFPSQHQQFSQDQIKERDRLIEELENKIKIMAEEMLKTTEFMNKIYDERKAQADPQKPRPCCQAIENALKTANKKTQELAELLEQAEDESRLKAQQAIDAIKALNDYQKGKDGLVPALKKCSSLERKLQAREKQINTLIMELNSLSDTAQENKLLRKRLNIPEDVTIFTKNLAAKEKSKCKIIQHLNLKLRASEEMRLQLKMEKCDLRKQLLQLKQGLPEKVSRSEGEHPKNEEDSKMSSDEEIEEEEISNNLPELESATVSTEPNIPSNKIKYTNSESVMSTNDRLSPSPKENEEIREVGEIEDSFNATENSKQSKDSRVESFICTSIQLTSASKEIGEVEDDNNVDNFCKRCQLDIQHAMPETQRQNLDQFGEVIHENKLLRQGMLEILEKLREYDDSSEQIIIDTLVLHRLLNVLQCQSNANVSSSTNLRKQLQASQEREQVLEELLRQEFNRGAQSLDKGLNEIEEIREDGEIHSMDMIDLKIPALVDSTTRPTTPDRENFPPLDIPEIYSYDPPQQQQQQQQQSQMPPQPSPTQLVSNRTMEQNLEELKIYRKHYEELYLHMKSSESEIMQRCADLTEKLKCMDIETRKERKKVIYLEEDLNQHLIEKKAQQMNHLEKEMSWEIEIDNLKIEIEYAKEQFNYHQTIYCYTKDEFNNLQNAYEECLSKLAFLTDHLLSDKDKDKEIKIPNLSNNYVIIDDDNYPLNIITQEEYEEKENLLKVYHGEKLEMMRKISQLESLVELGQQQIQSQQKLLNDITDNHTNLRHLVADLQSTNEEKFLIAKLQRDTTKAKTEIKHLENECQNAKENIKKLQKNLLEREQLMKKLEKDFQYESRQNTTKLRFLQKSLFLIKEKYAKYTPLVLLTNYICALEAFQKHIEANAKNVNFDSLSVEIEQLIKSKVGNDFDNLKMEEQQQQHLIKLIKSETQCKLYEDQVDILGKKCYNLEKQLNSLRLSQAMESEHWQTIQVLFESEKHLDDLIEKTQKNLKVTQEILTKDAACNTIELGKVTTDQNGLVKCSNKHTALTQTSPKKYAEKLMLISREQQTSINGEKMANQLHCTKEIQTQTSTEAEQQRIMKENKAVQTLHEEKPAYSPKSPSSPTSSGNLLKSQLTEALRKCQEVENKYSQAELIIQDLQDKLKSMEMKMAECSGAEQKSISESISANLQTDVIEKTIVSFHTLLSEKDKSISKYQDLLQSEREQCHLSLNKLNAEIERLNNIITTMNACIKDKDLEILDLKSQLEVLSQRRNDHEKLQLATQITAAHVETVDDNIDNSLNEMTDEKIEELFQQGKTSNTAASSLENLLEDEQEDDNENKDEHHIDNGQNQSKEFALPTNIKKQMRELKEKASFWESNLKVKEDEIQILHEKIKLLQEREKSVKTNSAEVKQLKELLEEKDKHINELLDTLNNFHDDQERFINNTSNHSADKIAKLANDITRTETTNKVYRTQIEALKKQLASVTQREKQSHDVNISLRNQLIKRPVVSIKSELNARVKNETLQKRIQQLELDLEDAHAEIQRQKVLLDTKRNRNTLEVGLWEKQKRWQQTSEKYKMKFEESEASLEKTRSLLQTARNTINRLEKEKQMLTAKVGKGNQQSPRQPMKCCRAPSCPNLHQPGNTAIVKYTPSESPEQTLTGTSSPCSSPCRSGGNALLSSRNGCSVALEHHHEIVEALKARLEMQQRKILSLELRGPTQTGGNYGLNGEMNEIQEKLATVEAQNTRLEAKNIQLQLDIDMLRQGDATERLQKRIKHLEDYIIALKEEMASIEARRQLCKCNGGKIQTQTGQSAEHTILLLRNLVDKLKSENKYLKEGRNSSESKTSLESSSNSNSNSNSNDSIKLRQLYNQAVEKIEELQRELKSKSSSTSSSKCPDCELNQRKNPDSSLKEELTYIKELLRRKSQLLQKAKVLLTRAAAKEKVLKEQLTIWKRKCFELQNVPVIEEISE